MAKELTLIKVGHGAYKGENELRMCFSRAQAVRVLCNRGFTRDQARAAVKKAIEEPDSHHTAHTNNWAVVEVNNALGAYERGDYHRSYEELKALWKNHPEL